MIRLAPILRGRAMLGWCGMRKVNRSSLRSLTGSSLRSLTGSLTGSSIAGLRAFRRGLGWMVLAAIALAPPAALAQVPAVTDSGVFVVFDHDQPIAHERWHYQMMGDSIVVTALAERTLEDETHQRHAFRKAMLLVVDRHDLGLMRYLSTQTFDGRTDVRGILPGDTVMTYYRESDTGGKGDRLVQPPGRLFVLDSQLFTLFDVMGRSVASREFHSRPIQLLALGADTLTAPVATLTRAAGDSLAGDRRTRLVRYGLDDESLHFDFWTDPEGRLVRFEHAPSGLRVERLTEPARAARAVRRKPARRARKP